MKAMLCRAHGGPETLTLGELPDPAPGPGQVLVRVAAAGVNFADVLMVEGKYQEKPAFPFAPGLEVAGTVEAVGGGVTRVEAGQRVLALVGTGGFAELALAAESDVFVLLETMDFETAAGFPITYGTAHGALTWRADLQPGETLAVHGAAGGVGLATVEVGKALGARVIASAGGPEKLAVAAAHGADETIDYRQEDLRQRLKALTGGRGVDVVFDPVGGPVFDGSLRSLAWGGRLVVIGFAGGEVPQAPANLLLVKNIGVLGFYWGSYRKHAPDLLIEQFAELFAWYRDGKLQPLVSQVLPLAEAARALMLLKNRQATGKVVVAIR
ncbi:NADPH2:quinone reductase [Tistlia consotensis]|uniref:NADPH2:quinone reductase n=1 Tax=Tistlia consotensis USBA 355 TaxID=560819 RepID=A0A1Y6CKF5_9PROT|nr:NADPH:quinone oxidoreductase family protein [Tistlia consotensis]SMF72764.1 NADPH2:quinone reductase [Tistlia consotensis USBA 355]SNS09701.1 NADPH2:quinone reductase [Tistlia consotensis]